MAADYKKFLLCIIGPTAVGKTALAIQLARHFHTEIISADSRQFFKEMSIGTAKPSGEELGQVVHHFIGNVSIDQLYSAGDFERDALKQLDVIFARHNIAVMVGGSGLYIKAVCEGLDDMPRADIKLREELQKLFEERGIEALQEKLKATDPVRYSQIDVRNTQRVMRAIEVAEQEKNGMRATPSPKIQRPFRIIFIGLDLPREELYARINARVSQMMDAGLLQEAAALFPHRHLNALQTVGYTEIFEHLEGRSGLDKAVDLIRQHTRNFAKRQLTWFRKMKDVKWFDPGSTKEVIRYIEEQAADTR